MLFNSPEQNSKTSLNSGMSTSLTMKKSKKLRTRMKNPVVALSHDTAICSILGYKSTNDINLSNCL